MKILVLVIFSLFQNSWESAKQISPIKFEKNVQLKKYDVSQSFKLNEKQYILIGERNFHNYYRDGFKMIYLEYDETSNRFPIKYVSKGNGEAFIYNPYFFEFANGELFIIAEQGHEYMSGIDIFQLDREKIKFLGYISVSGPNRNSIIKQMLLQKRNNEYKITFTGKVEYQVTTDNIVDGTNLSAHYLNNKFRIALK